MIIFIAILTNGRPEPQYAKVVALGLHKWFDDEHIFISGGIGYQKPDPQAFKYIENAFALNPEETWYVGDTYEADVVGANTAGCIRYGLTSETGSVQEKKRADITIKSIEELKEVIRGQIG